MCVRAHRGTWWPEDPTGACNHLKARSMAKLQDMARRAVIRLRGPVIALRKAGRNLINGLHREGINLSQAQLSGCALAHARPPAALDACVKMIRQPALARTLKRGPVLRPSPIGRRPPEPSQSAYF